jgi:hypothetical protein
METRFLNLCVSGNLQGAQKYYQSHPNIDIAAMYDDLFSGVCLNGYLAVAQWLHQVCPSFDDILASYEGAFCCACYNGCLHVAQWLLQVCPTINISAGNDCSFNLACVRGQLRTAQWLQSLKPYLYVIEYDENGKITDYKIRSKEEANWQKRKYLVWLASNDCPEENKNNLLYKLPSDVSRLIILHL